MSSSITAYRTIFVKPEKQQQIIDLDRSDAFAVVFTPLDNVIEEVRFLLRVSGSEAITYQLGLFTTNAASPYAPANVTLSELAAPFTNGIMASSYSITGSTDSFDTWLRFNLNFVSSYDSGDIALGTKYALVLTSSLGENNNQNANGITIARLPAEYSENAGGGLYGCFKLVNGVWLPLTQDSATAAPVMFMYGSALDDSSNPLDLGDIQTSGPQSARGYPIFITLKNVGASTVSNIKLISTSGGGTSVGEPEETFASACRWMRLASKQGDDNYLPTSYQRLYDSMVAADNGTTLRSQSTAVYVQKDRIYPFPRPYIKIDETDEHVDWDSTVREDTDLSNLVVVGDNNVIYNTGTDGSMSISQVSVYNFHNFKLEYSTGFNDKTGYSLPIKSQSPLVSKMIRYDADHDIDDGFEIKEHPTSKSITADSRRIYPDNPNINSVNASQNAKVSQISEVAVFSRYHQSTLFKTTSLAKPSDYVPSAYFPLISYSLTRFIDSGNQEVNGKFNFKKMFPLSVDDTSVFSSSTESSSNYIESADNQIPFFVAHSALNTGTGGGNVLDSLGFLVYRGTADEVQTTFLKASTYDKQVLEAGGLHDRIIGGLNQDKERGLILTQHYMQHFCGQCYVPAYVVSSIQGEKIYSYGMVVSTGNVIRSGISKPTSNYIFALDPKRKKDSVVPKEDVTNASSTHKLYLCLDPFSNTNLDDAYLIDSTASLPTLTFMALDTVDGDPSSGNSTFLAHTAAVLPDSIDSNVYKYYPWYLTYYNSTITTETSYLFNEGIVLLFDVQTACVDSDLSQTFYNEYNLNQIKKFIDDLPANTAVSCYTTKRVLDLVVTPVFSTTTKATMKTGLETLWDNVRSGVETTASTDYKDIVTKLMTTIMGGGVVVPTDEDILSYLVYFFGANNSTTAIDIQTTGGSPTSTVDKDIYDNKILFVPIEIYPASRVTVANTDLDAEYNFTSSDYTFFDQLCESNVFGYYHAQTAYKSADYYTDLDHGMSYDIRQDAGALDYFIKGYYNFASNSNLCDVMKAEYFAQKRLFDYDSGYIPYIRDYSLIIPFFEDCEMEPSESTRGTDNDNCYFRGVDQLYDDSAGLIEYNTVEQDHETGSMTNDGLVVYEAMNDPHGMWSAYSDKYIAYNKYKNPSNPANINLDDSFVGANVTESLSTFNFYNQDTDNPVSELERCWIVNIDNIFTTNYAYGYGYGYTTPSTYGYASYYESNVLYTDYFDVFEENVPTDEFNRITFSYRVGVPSYASSSSTVTARIVIEVSDTVNFDRDSSSTQTVFDGVINGMDPTSIVPNGFFSNVIKSTGYQLPNGDYMFLLDLKYALTKANSKYLRIYAEQPTNSIARNIQMGKLRVYLDNDRKYGITNIKIPSVFGTSENTQNVLDSTGTTFHNNGEYVVVDLGRERQVKFLEFTIDYAGGSSSDIDDVLSISYKNFNKDFYDSEKLVQDMVLKNIVPPAESTKEETMVTNFFARLIIFSKTGNGTFKLKSLKIGCASTSSIYLTTDKDVLELVAQQPECAFYDENILQSPSNRLAITNNPKHSYIGLRLGDTAQDVCQISFNCIKNTQDGISLFKLQKTSASPYSLNPTSGWTDIGAEFNVKQYQRLPTIRLSSGNLVQDGTVVAINKTSASIGQFADNGLIGWVLKPDSPEDLMFSILESWVDTDNGYIRVNADLSFLGFYGGMNCIIENPTVINFPSTTATALQLVQVSPKNGTTKINGLKAYANIITSDVVTGKPITVTPTPNTEWFLEISTNN